jgi:hypothetical protein
VKSEGMRVSSWYREDQHMNMILTETAAGHRTYLNLRSRSEGRAARLEDARFFTRNQRQRVSKDMSVIVVNERDTCSDGARYLDDEVNLLCVVVGEVNLLCVVVGEVKLCR